MSSLYHPGRYTPEQIRKVENLMDQAEKLHIKMRTLTNKAEKVLGEKPDDLNDGYPDDAFDAIWNQAQP